MVGVSPKCFGPPCWTFLHMVSFAYPEKIELNEVYPDYGGMTGSEIQLAYYNFFKNLSTVLPCVVCREHYKKNFKDLENSLDTREDFINWVYNLHNLVNEQTGASFFSKEAFNKKYADILNETKSGSENSTGGDTCDNTCETTKGVYCKVELIKEGAWFSSMTVSNWLSVFLLLVVIFLLFKVYRK